MVTWGDHSVSWLEAATLCVSEYGTSLATIQTYWDLIEANYVVNRSIDIDFDEIINLYIGLYSEPVYFSVNGSSSISVIRKWQWLMNNGSDCHYCTEEFRNLTLDTEKFYGVQMSFPLIFGTITPSDASIASDGNSGMLCNGMTLFSYLCAVKHQICVYHLLLY